MPRLGMAKHMAHEMNLLECLMCHHTFHENRSHWMSQAAKKRTSFTSTLQVQQAQLC